MTVNTNDSSLTKLMPDDRLLACAGFIRDGSSMADIGTDHAYLPIWLASNKKVSKAVACDVNKSPLDLAQKNIIKYGVEDVVTTKLSDGLFALNPTDIDDIVIAGMGGELIESILHSASDKFKNPSKRFILQPMSKEDVLRRYLACNGFFILSEMCVISKKKPYTVMCTVFTGDDNLRFYPDLYPYIGKIDITDKASCEYIKKQIRKLKNKQKGLSSKHLQGVIEKLEVLV